MGPEENSPTTDETGRDRDDWPLPEKYPNIIPFKVILEPKDDEVDIVDEEDSGEEADWEEDPED